MNCVQVTREVFEASKGRLKVVGRAGVGIDNVDLVAATEVGRIQLLDTVSWIYRGNSLSASLCPVHGKFPAGVDAEELSCWNQCS